VAFHGSICIQKQDPYRTTAIAPISAGTNCGIWHTVAINIAQRCDRHSKLVIHSPSVCHVTLRLGNLLVRFHRTVGMKEQHPYGTRCINAIIIPMGSCHQVWNPIIVHIPKTCNGESKKILRMQNPSKLTLRVTDFLEILHRAVLVQKEDPHSTKVIRCSKIGPICSHGQILHAVMIQVSKQCY